MKKASVTAACCCLLFVFGGCKKGGGGAVPAKGTIGPLATFCSSIVKGSNAVLAGGDLAKAFAPLTPDVHGELAGKLKEAKVKSLKLLGMEFELLYYKGDKGAYYLRTFVYPGASGPAFLNFKGRTPTDGKIYVKGKPFADYKGPAAAPLAEAAEALTAAIKGGKCGDLQIANLDELKKIAPEKLVARMERDIAKTKKNLQKSCQEASKIDSDKVELRIDDIAVAALGADGKMVGMVKGDLRLEGQVVKVKMRRFRAFK